MLLENQILFFQEAKLTAQSRVGGRLMSQGPWKINEGRFLHQITFTYYYTCFLLKNTGPHWSLWPRAGEM